MYEEAETLDDLLRKVFEKLAKVSFDISATRGRFSEVAGVLLRLRNPRARLSRTEDRGKPFSALGEMLWYFTKSNDLGFIEYYLPKYRNESDDGKTVYGGYGPRLFKMHSKIDQIGNVVNLLKARPTSRRAVVQLFDSNDINGHVSTHPKDIPCTCTIQFLIRDNRLLAHSSMRSNDAYFGLPHDVFSFTMIQEMIASELKIEVGDYTHTVGSLHLYEDKKEKVLEFLDEGWQATDKPMPKMPAGDPFGSVATLLKLENLIRERKDPDIDGSPLDEYWKDLVKLLQILRLVKDKDVAKVQLIKNSMSTKVYSAYIDQKLADTKSS